MKTAKLYTLIFLAITVVGCDKDFLEVPPIDQLTDETYWTTETNVRTFANGFYATNFTGYGVGYSWGDYFAGQALNDDFVPVAPPEFAPSSPIYFVQNVPTSGGGWTFAGVRKANIFIDRVQDVPMEEEAINHWTGIGRFFRGLEYHDLVNRFGDVPWYEEEFSEEDIETLYKPRDSRTFVMDKVLEDFRYAAEHVRGTVENEKQMVDRNVVIAFMSRVFLFEGTWQKYHAQNPEKAAEYLEASKWAANEVIQSGDFTLDNYKDVFTSLNLAENPEVILYREYEPGILTHTLNTYNNLEPQTGVSKDAIDFYLAEDGLPIEISPLYQGDQGIEKVMADRDARLYQTVVQDELRIRGIDGDYSTSGYATHKFLNEDIADNPLGNSSNNPTDAPIIRYGEVLINYAEAAAELATLGGSALTQEDLDKSINVLRNRPGIELPDLQIMGGQPAVNGNTYEDPNKDPDVTAMIWEIRRERRVELMMEGFRLDDLRRWGKLEYVDTVENFDVNLGAWINKNEYPDADLSGIKLADASGNLLPANATEGYIVPTEVQRRFTDPRVYLSPIPLDQITLYSGQGITLEQNPGW